MDGRAAFAAGGFLAGAAAVAVACAVTLSNAAALADTPGEAAGVDVVRVTPALPAPAPSASGAVAAPVVVAPRATAEVVPAPEPEDVAAPGYRVPSAEPVPEAPAEMAPPAISEQEAVARAMRTGDWPALRSWAEQRGWTQEKIDRWVARLQLTSASDDQGQDAQRELTTDRSAVAPSDQRRLELTTPDDTSDPGAGRAHPAHPETPAKNAGSPSERGNSSSHGWKRDQSPKPPDGD